MAISGKDSVVSLGSSTLCARNWSITSDKDILDATTTCSGGNKEYIEGLVGYTGSVMSYTYVSVDSGLQGVSISDDEVTYSGSAFIKTDFSGSVDGLEEFTYNLTFSGAVTVS